MPTPPALKSIDQILVELNPLGTTEWRPIDGYYILQGCEIVGKGFNVLPNGAVLKAFFNTRTGEVKTFLAKSIAIPEGLRDILWQD